MNRTLLVLIAAVASAGSLSCREPSAAQSTPRAGAPPAGSAAPAQPAPTPAATESAPPKPMPPQLPEVLARVNGEPVTKSDFDRLILNLEANNGRIPAARRDEILRSMLDQLITYTAMSQQARQEKIVASDGEIDSRIKQMQGGASDAEFKKGLEARKMSTQQLRNDARVQLTIEKLLELHVADTAVTTEVEARAYYDKNPDKFKQGDKVRASHILLKVDSSAPERARKQAQERIAGLLKRARSGEDFAALAAKHSEDGSARQGGDLGYFESREMVPAFSDVAFRLKPGEISDVVTTEFGYHIIKVTDRTAAMTIPYEKASDQIVEFLSRQKKQERADQFVHEVRKRARVEVLV